MTMIMMTMMTMIMIYYDYDYDQSLSMIIIIIIKIMIIIIIITINHYHYHYHYHYYARMHAKIKVTLSKELSQEHSTEISITHCDWYNHDQLSNVEGCLETATDCYLNARGPIYKKKSDDNLTINLR